MIRPTYASFFLYPSPLDIVVVKKGYLTKTNELAILI